MIKSKKSKKRILIEKIFNLCKEKQNYVFDNSIVKYIANNLQFKNPFDATKVDNLEILPEKVRQNNYFIIYLGKGKHKFVRGINISYHNFEEIPMQNIWYYRKSILNELDTSESSILSLAFNQRIIHDFLYEDIVANSKMYGASALKNR